MFNLELDKTQVMIVYGLVTGEIFMLENDKELDDETKKFIIQNLREIEKKLNAEFIIGGTV